jgi:type IV secretory pathway VirB2 component (pilin)
MAAKKYYFQKLTPVSDADICVYEEAIDFAFDNPDVKNVAISGAYSAGKSSILESYKAKHKDHRFVHLSLAHFRTPEQENSESEETVKESVLEGKILNQLIHQIPAERIPQTNFRVKKGVSAKYVALLTVFSSFFIGSIVSLLSSSKVASFVAALSENWIKTILSVLFSPYATIPAILICAACSVALIFFADKGTEKQEYIS